MKKLLFSAFVLTAFVCTTYAQEVKFGAKAGLNLSSVNGDDYDDAETLTGFHLGAVAEIMISDKFSFQPELLFSSQGAKFEESDEFGSYEEKTKLNYLNIPLMAKLYLAEGFSLEAGPQVGFLMSANSKGEETFNGETEEFDDDIKDFVKGTDIGLNFGLGYKLESGLNFGARYNLGLTDVNDVEDFDSEAKNGVIQISIGYFF